MKIVRYKTTCYSQKEFGIKEDIRELTRVARGKVSDYRTIWADKLQNKANELVSSQGSLLDQHLSNRVINPTLEKKLLRESFNRGNRVIGARVNRDYDANHVYSSDSPFFFAVKHSKAIPTRMKNKIINATKKSKNIIFHPSNSGSEKLAHELGHTINMGSRNPYYRIVNQLAGEANQDFSDSGMNYRNPLKAAYDSGMIILEEANANRHARKFLKKHGISPEEMKIAEKSLKAGMDSYKNLGKAAIYNSLGNVIRGKQ